MTGAALALHQFRYDQRRFWREPASVFFTVVMPLLFLLLFSAIFGDAELSRPGGDISFATYFVPGILTLSLVAATFVNLTIALTGMRERGELKRSRATPVPAWAIIAGRTLTALGVTAVMVVLLMLLGALAFGVKVPTRTLPAALVTIVLGVASLSALGFAFTAFVPSENAAPPMANAVVLPLYFISGIFVPADQLPAAMDTIAAFFPVQPLFQALLTAFDPYTTGAGFAFGDLAAVAVWGAIGAVVAIRRFRWVPHR